ncbi:MAG TPA: hypothetical protein VMF69_18620 [Gemmataceae bacterium]|nr:hypothetical protein [Gemmataceae bacterium]
MKAWSRRMIPWSLGSLLLLAGCNFPYNMYFLMPEDKDHAELKRLAAEDRKKEVKVVLWTYMGLDPREEFIQADRHLAAMLAEEIRRLSEENKDKVTVVKPSLVEQYKSRHPNWQSLEPEQVGHDFKADYVINLEIGKLSLYEPNAYQQLYRGQTQILVSVVEVEHPDDVAHKEFNDRYPNDATGSLDTYDLPATAFRDKFLQHVAKRLALYFVDHKRRTERVMMDDD